MARLAQVVSRWIGMNVNWEAANLIKEVKTANAQIAELERELGKARGKLDRYRERQYRAPGWWRVLFGGEAE